jgi:hypothetical protein
MSKFYDFISGSSIQMADVLTNYRFKHGKVDHVLQSPHLPQAAPPPPTSGPTKNNVWPGDPAIWKPMSMKPTQDGTYNIWIKGTKLAMVRKFHNGHWLDMYGSLHPTLNDSKQRIYRISVWS